MKAPEDAVEGASPLSIFAARILGDILSVLLRLWALTLRLDNKELRAISDMVARGESLLIVFWHGQFFPLFVAAEGFDATVVVASSWRGMVISRICRRFGYRAVLTRGKHNRLPALETAIGTGSRIASLALDGSSGPQHIVKKGALRIASDLGFRILPLYVESRRALVLGWRWDKREIPLPFSSVRLRLGQPLDVPPGLGRRKIEAFSAKLEHEMQALESSSRSAAT